MEQSSLAHLASVTLLDADGSRGGFGWFRRAQTDFGWGQVTDALVVAAFVVVVDEDGEGGLKFAFEDVGFE